MSKATPETTAAAAESLRQLVQTCDDALVRNPGLTVLEVAHLIAQTEMDRMLLEIKLGQHREERRTSRCA